MNNIIIRNLNSADMPSVVEIHTMAFPDSLLTRMDRKVIRKYYEWQSQPPNECNAIGAFQNEKMAGFCYSGSFRDAEVYFILRHWYLAIPAILREPSLLRQIDPIKRLLYITKAIPQKFSSKFVRKNESRQVVKKYGILSIAVSPELQGSGVGAKLLQAVYKDASTKGYNRIQLSVHPDNGKAVSFYEKEGWVKALDNNRNWDGAMIKDIRMGQ